MSHNFNIREGLYKRYENIKLLMHREKEKDMIAEKERVLKILDEIDKWDFQKEDFDIYFWIKVPDCKSEFGIKFYKEIALENHLDIVCINYETYKFKCYIIDNC